MSTTQAATSVKGAITGMATTPPTEAAANAAQTVGAAVSTVPVTAPPVASTAATAVEAASNTLGTVARTADVSANATTNAGGGMPGAVDALARTDAMFTWGGYFQALAILFLVLALLWAALWFLKRKGGFKLLTMHGDLAIESRLTLGPKKSLIVVRFLNKKVLLGVTDQQITMLTELPTNEDDTHDTGPEPEKQKDFKAQLKRAVHNGEG